MKVIILWINSSTSSIDSLFNGIFASVEITIKIPKNTEMTSWESKNPFEKIIDRNENNKFNKHFNVIHGTIFINNPNFLWIS